jgi:hypothetical protein
VRQPRDARGQPRAADREHRALADGRIRIDRQAPEMRRRGGNERARRSRRRRRDRRDARILERALMLEPQQPGDLLIERGHRPRRRLRRGRLGGR